MNPPELQRKLQRESSVRDGPTALWMPDVPDGMIGAVRYLEGVVRLPQAELVAEDVLGQTFMGRAEAATFELTYPRLPAAVADGEIYRLEAPYPVEAFVSDLIRESDKCWGYASNTSRLPSGQQRTVGWQVECLALRVTNNDADGAISFYELADQFGSQLNAWYSRVQDWTELWSGRVVPRDQMSSFRTRAHVRDIEQTYPEGITGWGGTVGDGVHFATSEFALKRSMLASAFARASADEEPPTEWQLYLRSLRTTDRRIAVIDAATATEVCLTRAIDTRLGDFPPDARYTITKQANGLVGLLTLAEQIGGVPSGDSLIKRVKDRLARQRNDAAHRGLPPIDAYAAKKALTTARDVLERYSPLAQPDHGSLEIERG